LELPHIEKIWTEYRDPKKFHLLVIGREESMDSVREFRSKNGFSFPIAPDPDREIYSLFAKELIPRTIVVSPEGAIVYFKAGFDERDLDELSSVLTQEIAGLK
jgi:peroxiredoxin